ncbi:TonB-dependent receptor [Sandaracinobacter neustonicus]|uniref:TonB-dependent receptor n=1 Tax=Sandaracinobacter neustonicus TaxID=1715348 RepID=UPI0015E3B2DF|nr:TonB-dependent receptor [Sandaracinobacter neustonicus]
MRTTAVILATTVSLPSLALAGELRGTVTNPALSRPLSGARVTVDGIAQPVWTDADGRYRLTDIPAGEHELRIELPGYTPFSASIVIPETGDVTRDVEIALAGGSESEIVVLGSRASRLAALERKRSLPVIADVVAADTIGQLPDYNTAQALQRLPGISVQTDQGEPRYVVVRGVDPNLNQVTVDGNLVGIPEAEGRRVALDTIPSDLVAAIEVVKAVTPDYDANAVGGSINIVTPTAFDRTDDFLFASAKISYSDAADKFGYGGSVTYGAKFGADDQFGIVAAGSYFKRFIHSQLAGPRGWTAFGQEMAPTSFVLYDYRIMRERIGGIVNLDWRPDDDTRFYLRTIYNEYTDEEERDQFNWDLARGTQTFPAADQIAWSRGRATREFRQNNQTQKLYNISPGTELTLGNVQLDLNYTYARAQEHTPVRTDIEFRSTDTLSSTLDLTQPSPTFVTYNPAALDPAAYPLRRIRMRSEEIDEDLHAFRADLRYDIPNMEGSFLKFGGKFTDRKKHRDNRQSLETPTTAVTFAQTGAFTADIPFFDGVYDFGPGMNYQGVLDYFASRPGSLALDTAATAINDLRLDYDIHEKIYAGYGMASLQLGELTVIGGVRVEKTDGSYSAFAIRDSDGDGTLEPSDILPVQFSTNYTDVLPSLHLNYRLQQDLLVRAAWTNTIGRPNYDAQVPTFEEEDGSGTAGNPNLQPYRAMGLDLSLEYYPDADTLFSLAGFYKKIENPIFTRTIQNTSFAGVPLLTLSQPQNADSGELLGIEAAMQKRFTFLPRPLDGLGLSANVTYVDSSVDVPGRETEDLPFFRQSKWLFNAALFYEKGPFEARVAVTYRDDYLEGVGASKAGDTYVKGRTVVDARVSYRVTDRIEVFASGADLNNASVIIYQATPSQLVTDEVYSFTADFGVNIRF